MIPHRSIYTQGGIIRPHPHLGLGEKGGVMAIDMTNNIDELIRTKAIIRKLLLIVDKGLIHTNKDDLIWISKIYNEYNLSRYEK